MFVHCLIKMKIIEFLLLLLTIPFVVSRRSCIHRYHLWRPFFGEFAADDFIAATDTLGRRSYIGKVIPFTEKRSWTQPTQIMFDYTQFAWEDGKLRRQDRFLEIMAIERVFLNRFEWLSVHSPTDLLNIEANSCLVEGGILNYNGRTVKTYIGRTQGNGSFFVGPVYLQDWAMKSGLHFLVGERKINRKKRYQVLSYLG